MLWCQCPFSVRLSVTFVHCGHRVQWIVDIFACLDRWMSLLLTDALSGSSDGMMPEFLVEVGGMEKLVIVVISLILLTESLGRKHVTRVYVYFNDMLTFLARDVIYYTSRTYAMMPVRLSVCLWRLCTVVTGCDGSRISLHAWIDGCLYYLLGVGDRSEFFFNISRDVAMAANLVAKMLQNYLPPALIALLFRKIMGYRYHKCAR